MRVTPSLPQWGRQPKGSIPLTPICFSTVFLKREFFNQPFKEQLHFFGSLCGGSRGNDCRSMKRASEQWLMISTVSKNILVKKINARSRSLFSFLFSHDPREESPCTTVFAFKFGKFCIEFFLFTAEGFWCNNFYPDQQVSGMPTAPHSFSPDL